MNEMLIENWNATVGVNDEVYVLGDFAYRETAGEVEPIFERLRGRKHLLIGNHDSKRVRALPWHSTPTHYREITENSMRVVLFHYPIRDWNAQWHGSVHLHGHVHGTLQDYSKSCDMAADRWNYRPATLADAWGRMLSMPANPDGPQPKPAG